MLGGEFSDFLFIGGKFLFSTGSIETWRDVANDAALFSESIDIRGTDTVLFCGGRYVDAFCIYRTEAPIDTERQDFTPATVNQAA
jgi:hypothetical protein